jgi:hypothetical protein
MEKRWRRRRTETRQTPRGPYTAWGVSRPGKFRCSIEKWRARNSISGRTPDDAGSQAARWTTGTVPYSMAGRGRGEAPGGERKGMRCNHLHMGSVYIVCIETIRYSTRTALHWPVCSCSARAQQQTFARAVARWPPHHITNIGTKIRHQPVCRAVRFPSPPGIFSCVQRHVLV